MTATKKLSRRAKTTAQNTLAPCLSCLQQAEICREQARDAARLKRFHAALGLFSTASALCRHVCCGQEADDSARSLAAERMLQIDLEMATYAELARIVAR